MDGTAVDSANLVQYLNGLSFVTSRQFVNDFDPSTLTPDFTITFAGSNRSPLTVEAFQGTNGMVIKSSENQDEVFRDEKLVDKLFKGKRYFIP
jgi:hypothetical protein